jgi:hypothetical protein
MAFGRRVTPDVYVVVDGTLIPIGRVAAYRPRCCGEDQKHGMNLQVIARFGGGNGSLCHLHASCVGLAHTRVGVL